MGVQSSGCAQSSGGGVFNRGGRAHHKIIRHAPYTQTPRNRRGRKYNTSYSTTFQLRLLHGGRAFSRAPKCTGNLPPRLALEEYMAFLRSFYVADDIWRFA